MSRAAEGERVSVRQITDGQMRATVLLAEWMRHTIDRREVTADDLVQAVPNLWIKLLLARFSVAEAQALVRRFADVLPLVADSDPQGPLS